MLEINPEERFSINEVENEMKRIVLRSEGNFNSSIIISFILTNCH